MEAQSYGFRLPDNVANGQKQFPISGHALLVQSWRKNGTEGARLFNAAEQKYPAAVELSDQV